MNDAPIRDTVDRQRSIVFISIVVFVCAASLLAGYALKACPSAVERTRLGFACHTDITALYGARGIDDGIFPYVEGRLVGDLENGRLSGYDLKLVDGANEYPVLTGLFMWAMGSLAGDTGQYLLASAAFLSIAVMATAALLGAIVGWRSLLWSASPVLVLFAFHNWDVLAVAVTMLGVAAWWRRHPALAAVAFGVGGALKLYPLLLVVPLVLDRWHRRDRRGALLDACAASGTFAVANVPIMILGFEGWLVTYRFHSLRPPNYDSLWGVGPLYDLGPGAINVLSTALFLVTAALVLVLGGRRATREGPYPFIQVSAALVAAFLLWGKVHSPQYALWLLPFFALVRIRAVWWIAYVVDAVVLYFGVFVLGTLSVRALEIVVPAAVYIRAGLLLAMVFVFLRGWDATHPTMDGRASPRPAADTQAIAARADVETSA